MGSKVVVLIAASFLSGCAGPAGNPNARVGSWQIEHYNDANLEAMVANPADLQRGRGDGAAIGETATAAITRLRTNTVKPLAETGIADIKPVNTGAAAGAGTGQ